MTAEELKTAVKQVEQLVNSRDFERAEAKARALLTEPLLQSEHESRIITLVNLSLSLVNRGLAKESLSFAGQALALAEQHDYPQHKASAFYNIGRAYNQLSDYPLALDYYEKALNIDEALGNKTSVASHLCALGLVELNLADYSGALNCFSKALSISEELGNKTSVAANLCNIGLVYLNLSDYSRALDYYGKALNIAEECGNKADIATVLGNIGRVHYNLSDYNRALEYSGKALCLNEAVNNKRGIGQNFGLIGAIHASLLDYPRALDFLNKALNIDDDIGDKGGVAIYLCNIGSVHEKLGEYEHASDYLHRSLLMLEEVGGNSQEVNFKTEIGRLFANVSNPRRDEGKAEAYLMGAIAKSEEFGTGFYDAYKVLSDLYKQQGRLAEALTNFEMFHNLKEEAQSEESRKQATLMDHRRKIEESERDRQVKLARFQEQEKILHNILPAQIAERILDGEKVIADRLEQVSIFFSDIVGFTKVSQNVSPEQLVNMLNELFSEFDRIARKHGLEKIKTIGDAYMAVAGAPVAQKNHAERAANFALEVMQTMNDYRKRTGNLLEIRAGLHCGNAVAGIIGENKFSYDLWGDAVNTASRMESHGETGKIHVSEDFVNALQDCKFNFIGRGEMEIKSKGMMKTFFLTSN